MAKKRKNESDQPELPIAGAKAPENGAPPEPASSKPKKKGGDNGHHEIVAEAVPANLAHAHRPFNPGKIELPLHRRVNTSFLEYASYVIRDRAIPHLADGVKPVQRRILYVLHTMDDGKFIKVASVTGETMKYHPHGNASIDDAIVVLANKRYLIEGQGNFGNIFTGDPAAAPRYIECRMTQLALEELFN
jgi:hypothetical protein